MFGIFLNSWEKKIVMKGDVEHNVGNDMILFIFNLEINPSLILYLCDFCGIGIIFECSKTWWGEWELDHFHQGGIN